MEKSDWMLIGYVGTALGILFIVGALFCYSYFEIRSFIITVMIYPYREYTGPLLISGMVLLVIGLGCLWRAKEAAPLGPPAGKITKVCTSCGRVVAPDVKFCPYCGKVLPE